MRGGADWAHAMPHTTLMSERRRTVRVMAGSFGEDCQKFSTGVGLVKRCWGNATANWPEGIILLA